MRRRRHDVWTQARATALAAMLSSAPAPAHAEADALPPVALDYALQCQGCHLADGRGGGDIPSLHGIGWLAGATGGREYLARVPGVANASIDDERLAALLNWVLARWSADALPPEFERYRAEEIAARRRPLPDPKATRARLDRAAPGAMQLEEEPGGP